LLLTGAFPPGELWFLAWVAVVPLFTSIENQAPSKAFQYGLLAGLVHYLTLLYWVVVALGHYGNLPIPLAFIPLLLLCLYLSLYPAVFSILASHFQGFRFPILSVAIFWVGLEYLRAKLLTGFPWCLIGHSQVPLTSLIQISDICGVYGLSFVVLLGNGLLYRLFLCRQFPRRQVAWELALAVALIGASLLYGLHQTGQPERDPSSRRSITSVIIQGNIDQSVKWNPEYQTRTLSVYEELTRSARWLKPELIVWPETAVPFFFQDHRALSPRVISLAKDLDASLVFGSPAYERRSGETTYRNRAYLIPPGNLPVQHYDKIHLVPFGEYVPLQRFLFFVDRLVPAAGDFSPGLTASPLQAPGLSMGLLICYEAIFPELSREAVKNGANILINITNDAWFGMTSAPHQHLSMSIFRAVENKIPLVRAANTGISAFITPYGAVIDRTQLFETQVLTATLQVHEPELTVYARVGDLFAIGCLLGSLVGGWILIRQVKMGFAASARAIGAGGS
jgi:apolipoprotein N-acyltransferase